MVSSTFETKRRLQVANGIPCNLKFPLFSTFINVLQQDLSFYRARWREEKITTEMRLHGLKGL